MGSFDNLQLYFVVQKKMDQIAKEQFDKYLDGLAISCTSILRVLLKRNPTRSEINLKPIYEISLGTHPYRPSVVVRSAALGLLEYACSGRRFSIETEVWKGAHGYHARITNALQSLVKQEEFASAALFLPLLLVYYQVGSFNSSKETNLWSMKNSSKNMYLSKC